MHDWMQLVLAVLGSAPILGGIGWWFKTRHDDRVADKVADMAEIKRLHERIFDMQQERIREELEARKATDQTMKVLSEMSSLLKSQRPGESR